MSSTTRHKFKNSVAALAIINATALFAVTPVTANAQQDDEKDVQTIETIVVTARRSEESLLSVPATVNVLTESTITNAGVEDIEDIVSLTPGVTIVTNTAEIGDTQINIRGINGARDAESNVALVVDGILKTNTSVLAQNQGDLTQIEVLKGPQGAIYGRNAAAGAVVLSTRVPGQELELRGEAIAANDSTYSGFVSVNGPLSDTVGGLLSVDYYHTDGFYRNTGPNPEAQGATVDQKEAFTLNGRIMADMTDRSSLDFKARYSDVESGAIRYNTVFNLPNAAAALDFPVFNEDPDDRQPIFNPNIGSLGKQETFEASLKYDLQMDWADLTAWGLYSDVKQDFVADGAVAAFGFFNDAPECEASVAELFADGVTLLPPLFIGPTPEQSTLGAFSPAACDSTQYQLRNQEDISLEVRLASNDGDALQWSIGSYYLHLDRQVGVAIGYDRGEGVLRNLFNGPNTSNPTEQLANDKFTTDVYAVFGSLDYEFSPAFTLSTALRYDREERAVTNLVDPTARNQFLRGGNQPLNVGLDFGPLEDQKRAFKQLQPKVSLAWTPTDTLTLFANWGVGFKSGGFNNQGSAATIESAFNIPLIDAQLNIRDQFEKEKSSAFEAGAKAVLMDGRLTLDAAAYYTEVTDMQFFEFFAGPFGILRVVSNIDKVDIYGAEAAFNYSPVEYFTLFGSVNVNDSEIKANSARPGTEGGKSPYTADYTINLGSQVSYPFDNGMEASLRADYQIVGPTWFSTVQQNDVPTSATFLFLDAGVETAQFLGTGNFSNTQRRSYDILNLRASLENDGWRITAFANNVLKQRYLAEVIPAPEFGGSFFSPGNLRRWGVELGFVF